MSSASPSCTTVLTCPPGARLALEQLDLVRAREHVRRAEPGDSAADDRYPHNRYSSDVRRLVDRWPTVPVPVTAPLRRASRRHRPAAHEPDQPGRDARRGDRPAARDRSSAAGLLWNVAFHPVDLAIMVGMYVVCAFGITIGFHRYFTHRSFEARAPRQGDARDPRLHDDAGAADAVGHRSSEAPRVLRQGGRPALAARGARRRRARDAQGLRPRARRLDVHEPRDGAGPRSTGRTCTRTG